MEFICRHCERVITGRPYRVTSEEKGVRLLDMIVCYDCQVQARDLGLEVEELRIRAVG